MNDTTFQGDGEIAYVPVVVNAKLSKPITNADRIRYPLCGGTLSEIRTDGKRKWRHCYSCHMEQEETT